MTTKAPTRDLLIQVGMNTFAEHGYTATGINTVLKAAGVPKGSFYHYFSSKEAFGLAVVEVFAEDYDERFQALLVNSHDAPVARLRHYFEDVRQAMAECGHTRGCLIDTLGQEMSSQSDCLRDALDAIFKRWEGYFTSCLKEGQADGSVRDDITPQAMAAFILAGWQGALLRSKMARTCEPLTEFENTLLACIKR